MTETDISHMHGPYKVGMTPPCATWQDKAWQYIDKNGKQANFIFCQNTNSQTRISTIEKYDILPSPWHELLKAYSLELTAQNLSPTNKRKKISTARDLIINSDLFSTFSPNSLLNYWEIKGGRKNIGLLNSFILWLKNKKLIPSNIPQIIDNRQANDGSEELDFRRKKLPDEKVIMAMGAIHHEVIPWDKLKWKQPHPLNNQRNAFTCAMFTLSISSPNRAAAEQTVLNLQQLKTQTDSIDGQKKTVHYLDWSGSKGFDDNKNHILSQTAPVIRLILEYMSSITASNRIIARFYKQPNATLKHLLRDFRVNDKNWQLLTPDLEQKTNLFTLGYLLDFYKGSKIKRVLVSPATIGARQEVRNGPGKQFFSKPVAFLQLDDEVQVSSEQLGILFAINRSKELCKRLDLQGIYTVAEIQKRWLLHLKKQFPLLPLVRNETNEGFCDIEHRLFALNSYQLGLNGRSGGNDYVGSNSPFSLISPATMGKIYANDLGRSSKTLQSIFNRFGFADTFYITPHQMRHYMTDVADKGGLPIAINNMWGGRKDLSQIVHYVHTTNDDKASIISDILYNEDGKSIEEVKNSLRLATREQYDNASNEQGVASITSSGVCTQNLIVIPCTYLNDLNTQCVGCTKSCHIAHDEDAISLLKEDLKLQERRLQDVQTRPQFSHSKAMQSWFKLHLANTERLKLLIELMINTDIEPGSLIRMLVDSAEFRISNLRTKQVEIQKLALTDANMTIKKLIEANSENDNDIIHQLLEKF